MSTVKFQKGEITRINTKENRKKWLKAQFERLTQGVDEKKLLEAVEELNSVLSKKREVRVITNMSELRSEFWPEFWPELRSETWEYYENIWPVFVRKFYPRRKVIKRNKKIVDALQKIVEAGNCYLWISKTTIYVLPFPEIHLDEEKRLHNTKGYALKIADKESYWIHGVKLEKEEWEKAVRKIYD